jgi:hypothetical protein
MTQRTSEIDAGERYLNQLRYALRHARKSDRDDYVAQIADHIRESRSQFDPADSGELDELLRRLGPPSALAKEFYASERAKLNAAQRALQTFRRGWIAISVAVVVAMVVIIEIWAATYQPISLRMNGAYSDHVVALSGRAPVELSEGGMQPVTWQLTNGRYRVSVLFAVQNVNSIAVSISPPPTLQGIPNHATWHLKSVTSSKLSPFVSVKMRGHSSREIVFTTTYKCTPWPQGSPQSRGTETTSLNFLPIVMSFWGHEHSLELPVQPFYLAFQGNCFGQ